MFIERDDILINVNNVCCIAKEEEKISINLVSGKTIDYKFDSTAEANKAYSRLRDAIEKQN